MFTITGPADTNPEQFGFIYAAKSTNDPHASVPDQLRQVRAMFEAEGVTVLDEDRDVGFSAYSGNRGPGLARIEAQVRAAVEKYGRDRISLGVSHSDRIARGAGDSPDAPRHLVEIVVELNRLGATLRTVQDDLYRDPATNLLQAAMMGQRNTEDSSRKSGAVRDGKRRQRERGEKLSARVHDGYLLRVERDASDRIVARHYDMNREREALWRKVFDLALADASDSAITRAINAEGWRTETWIVQSERSPNFGKERGGKEFTRQRIREALLDPWYAGYLCYGWDRRSAPDKSAYVEGDHPAYLTPEQHRYLVETRAPKAAKRVSGKRPTAHALSGGEEGTGGCDECGAPLVPTYSNYVRVKKQPPRQKQYICANKHGGGTCTAPTINAEVLDEVLLEHLDAVIDIPAWVSELVEARKATGGHIASALAAERQKVAEAKAKASTFQSDYEQASEDGERDLARAAAAANGKWMKAAEDAEARIDALTVELARAEEPTPTDAMLDFANDLAAGVRDALGKTAMQDVSIALGMVFRKFWIRRLPDGSITVRPELHPDAGVLSILCGDGLRLVTAEAVNEAKQIVATDPGALDRWAAQVSGSLDSLDALGADIQGSEEGNASIALGGLLSTADPEWSAEGTALPTEIPALCGSGSNPW